MSHAHLLDRLRSHPWVRGFSWTLAGDLIARIALIITLGLGLALLGQGAFAQLTVLQAVATLAVAAWDLGVSGLTVRELAAGRVSVRACVRRTAVLRAGTLPCWVAALAAGLVLASNTGPLSIAAASLTAAVSALVSVQALGGAMLRGCREFRAVSASLAAGRWLTAALVLAQWASGNAGSVESFLAWIALGEATTLIACGVSLYRISAPGPSPDARDAVNLRAALPFSLTTGINIAYNRLDVLLVALIAAPATVGAYAPASRVQDALKFLPRTASAVTLPLASELYAAEAETAGPSRRLWFGTASFSVAGGIAIAAAVTASAWVFPMLFGNEYASSVTPIIIIAWSLPLVGLNGILAAFVNARRRSRFVPVAFASALVATLVLNVALTPTFGAQGAAAAAVLRELPLAIVLLLAAHATGLFRAAPRPALANAEHGSG